MFRIVFIKPGKLYDVLSQYTDPHIVDIRKEGTSEQLKKIYEKDYTPISELVNRGLTQVFLRKEATGLMRLHIFIDKCKDFERELIIVHSDEEQAQYIKNKLMGEVEEELCLML